MKKEVRKMNIYHRHHLHRRLHRHLPRRHLQQQVALVSRTENQKKKKQLKKF